MKTTVTLTRMNGQSVVLHGYFTLEGVIQYWEAVDPSTGVHVDLLSADMWLAVNALNQSVQARMRGAA